MKAVLHYRLGPGLRDRVLAGKPPWIQLDLVDDLDAGGLASALAGARVLLHALEPVTRPMIERAPGLRLVQKIGVGVNTIDLVAAREHGVAVANMPGTNSRAVAEMTLLLMLAALRRIGTLERAMREGRGWSMPREVFDASGELGGRVVGLVGFGEIPQRLTPVLAALGARVWYWSRTPKCEAVAQYRPLDELLAGADVVSLHLPLEAGTERLLDAARIATMKPGAILVNTARGGLVDEAALVEALRSGRLGAAGLDVFAHEPLPEGHPLLALDSVVLSPHVAWLTGETLARSMGVAWENCRRLRDGEPLLHRVA